MYFVKVNKKFEFQLRDYITTNNAQIGNLIYPKNCWLSFDFPNFLQNANFSIVRFDIEPNTGQIQELETISLSNSYKQEGYFVNIPLNLSVGYWYIKADLNGTIYKSFAIILVKNFNYGNC